MKRAPMSRFFCQELLYDYFTGNLSPERNAEIEAFLKTDEVCRNELQKLKVAIHYCESIRKIQTPAEWVHRWQHLPPALAARITTWETQMVKRFWKALPVAVVVLVSALGAWLFKPWKTIASHDLIVWSAV